MNNKLTSYTFATLTVVAFVLLVVYLQESSFQIELLKPYQELIIKGLGQTILVSLISLIGSLILGFVIYLLTVSHSNYLKALADVFTEIIYGTPLLVLIVIMAFVVGPAFGTFNRNLMGITAIILYMSPYMTNVFKAAISSISKDQYMAMDLFGFTSYQKYRYIIIPQLVRILMPPFMNNFSMIIKGSALLSVLSYAELFYAIRVAQSKTFAFVEGYILLWLLYLVITIPLSQFTKYVERRYGL